jgi:hypothetical protein
MADYRANRPSEVLIHISGNATTRPSENTLGNHNLYAAYFTTAKSGNVGQKALPSVQLICGFLSLQLWTIDCTAEITASGRSQGIP